MATGIPPELPRKAPPPGPSSWAEAVGDYVKDKCSAGPVGEPFHRFTRHAGGLVKGRQRAFHPVLQKPIDSEAEAKLSSTDRARLVKKVNRGMERALTSDSYVGYDLVSHLPKYGIEGAEKMGGMQKAKGKLCVQPASQLMEEPKEKKPRPLRIARRQYDIVKHRYETNHEERMQAKDDGILNYAGGIMATGRDPILGVSNDATVEERLRAEQAEREHKKRDELHATTRHTPAVVRRSEGHNYDILRGWVHDMDGVEHLDRKTRKGVPMRAYFQQTLQARVQDRSIREEKAAALSYNRKRHPHRTRDWCRSGYDILSGRPAPLPPIPSEDIPVCDILSRTVPSRAVLDALDSRPTPSRPEPPREQPLAETS